MIESTWSNAGVPVDEQLPVWEDVAARTWVSVTVSDPGGTGCRSSVSGRTVGDLTVARITTCRQVVRRLPSQVLADPGGKLFLNLPLVAGTTAAQSGRRAVLGAGDFAIVDSAHPFELTFPGPLRQVSLTVPHETLLPRLRAPDAAVGVRVAGDQGLGAVAAGAVRGLAAVTGPLDRHAARALSRHVVDLVALALGPAADPQVRLGTDVLRQAALDEVERCLGDPDLTPQAVADRLAISVRYLHRLFSDHGPSFGRWLLERRLERSRTALLGTPLPVAIIAREHGFRDPSYFTRAYRARFGSTPREDRREVALAA